MRRRVIMRLRNRHFFTALVLILTIQLLGQSSGSPSGQQPPATSATPPSATAGQTTGTSSGQQPPATSPPSSSAPAGSPTQAPGASGTQGAGQGANQSPDAEGGVFVFRKQVEEVVLHATVLDAKQRFVTNLDKTAFSVFEDGHPQTITSFRHEDIPVAMGIVVDNSGSMREKRQKVNAAALNLVRASNPDDEVFVVNFNDEYYLDQDFTSNINKLKEALEKIEARGGTALYDAVVASSDWLKRAKLEKKVIFVVTDGEDNASTESLEQAIRKLQAENGP